MAGETLDQVPLFSGANDVRGGDRFLVYRSGALGTVLYQGARVLPAVTTADEGKRLVVNSSGEWEATEVGSSTVRYTPIWTGTRTITGNTPNSTSLLGQGRRFSDYDAIQVHYSYLDGNNNTRTARPLFAAGTGGLSDCELRSGSVVATLIGTPGSADTAWDSFGSPLFPTSVVPTANLAPLTVRAIWGVRFRGR